jgi:hypothetical protein
LLECEAVEPLSGEYAGALARAQDGVRGPPGTADQGMFYVAGILRSELTPDDLSACFAQLGIASEVRDSQHYSFGQYLRIPHADVHMALERVSHGEYLIRADAESNLVLNDLCGHLSAQFSIAGLRHKLEIYDESDTLLSEYPAAR